jgi:hypothetical protein
MNKLTVKDSISNWTAQVQEFLEQIAKAAREDGWHSAFSATEVREEPTGLGATLGYTVPVLELTRLNVANGEERITFEPRHRFTVGATGRIDVYSHPALRDAMLLRVLKVEHPEDRTWEELEKLVGKAPWRAFSTERLPLDVDFSSEPSIQHFFSDLVA